MATAIAAPLEFDGIVFRIDAALPWITTDHGPAERSYSPTPGWNATRVWVNDNAVHARTAEWTEFTVTNPTAAQLDRFLTFALAELGL